MPDHQSQENVSRRKALKIIVGSAGAAVSPLVAGVAAPRSGAPACHISARAQASAVAAARAPRFFSEGQVKTLEALSETLIPADEHSPGAKAARVWEYIDAIIVDADESAKSLWTQGLAAVDKLAEREYQKAFADCAPDAPAWVGRTYVAILLSDTVLAAVAAPLVLFTAWQALRGNFTRHMRIARWTLPIWFYVSITGVVVYWMLYRLYP